MNITFTIIADSFDKAARLEALLKAEKISYCVKLQASTNDTPIRRTRQIITKAEIVAVATCFTNHPNWTVEDVAKSTGVGRATAGRIKLGTHVLQKPQLEKPA